MSFAFTVLCRIIIRIYLIRKWSNYTVNPSYIESKLWFYQFLTLGFLEFCTQCLGIHLLMDELRQKSDERYTYVYLVRPQEDDIIYLNIYGAIIFAIYLFKLVWIIGLYAYFWYYGGLKKKQYKTESVIYSTGNYRNDSLILK